MPSNWGPAAEKARSRDSPQLAGRDGVDLCADECCFWKRYKYAFRYLLLYGDSFHVVKTEASSPPVPSSYFLLSRVGSFILKPCHQPFCLSRSWIGCQCFRARRDPLTPSLNSSHCSVETVLDSCVENGLTIPGQCSGDRRSTAPSDS